MNLFNCKISYLKQAEDGSIYKKSEIYFVEALSFIEAETNLQKRLEEMIPEYNLLALSKVKVSAVLALKEFESTDNVYFKAKVAYKSIDEDSGKEKRVVESFIVSAETVDIATKIVNHQMSGSVSDWEVPSIVKTSIVDIFEYEKKNPYVAITIPKSDQI